MRHGNRSECRITPLRKDRRQTSDRRIVNIMRDGQGWQVGIPCIDGNDREVTETAMDSGKPAVVVNVEKSGVGERIDPAKYDLELREIANRAFRHRNELIEPVESEFVPMYRSIAQESQFLDRDVEKVIGMQTDERKPPQGPPDVGNLRRDRRDRYSHAAHDEFAGMVPPMHGVVATVLHLRHLPKVLPDPAVPLVLLRHGIRQPPQGMASALTPAAELVTAWATDGGWTKGKPSQQP